jgi:beta-RFAP synthase
MVVVHAPSRLHFGLLSPCPAPPAWLDLEGKAFLPSRCFGGVGLMIQAPGLRLRVEPAPAWSAEGPLASRALQFAEHFLQLLKGMAEFSPHRIIIEQSPPEHQGLGTGTQLGLAVAFALTRVALKLSPMDLEELAKRVGRGQRSGIGIHGFAHGGFLVDGGKRRPQDVAPLIARLSFPEAWRLVILLPSWGSGLHGSLEMQAFQTLPANHLALTDALCRLTLLGMLPALQEQDLTAFSESLYEFNRRAGEAFRPVQGGTYGHPETAEVVAFVRGQRIRGVGQSSWGPAVFAVTEDQERAEDLSRRLMERFPLKRGEVIVTAAANEGAAILQESQ